MPTCLAVCICMVSRIPPAMVKMVVNRMAVSMIARMAIRFLVLPLARLRLEIRLMHRLFLTRNIVLTCDSAVFDANDPVCHLRDFFVVRDHNDGLAEFLSADLEQPQHVQTGFAV